MALKRPTFALLAAAVLLAAVASAPAAVFAAPGGIEYTHGALRFHLTLPASWKGLYRAEEGPESVTFISVNNENAGQGGILFTIGVSDKDEEPEFLFAERLALLNIDGKFVYAEGPTDVNFNYENPSLRQEYEGMFSDLDAILESFRFPQPSAETLDLWGDASTWAVPELRNANQHGLIPGGFAGLDFTENITRVEFAAVAVMVYENLSGSATSAPPQNPFADTSDPEALKAYNAGLMMGVSGGRFDPDTLLDREQAATALTRVLKRAYIPGWTFGSDGDYELNFAMPDKFVDDDKISDWAKQSVYFMAANEIILGTGGNRFSPRPTTFAEVTANYASATREQAVVIGLRMVEKLKGKPLSYEPVGQWSNPAPEAPTIALAEHFGTALDAKFAIHVVIPGSAFDFTGSYHGSGEVDLETSYRGPSGEWHEWGEESFSLEYIDKTSDAIPFLHPAGGMEPNTSFRVRLTYRYTDDRGDHTVSSAWSDPASAAPSQ